MMRQMTQLSRKPLARSAIRGLESLWPNRLPALPVRSGNSPSALAALAVAAIAGGAMAIGALAIGRLVVGKLSVGRLRITHLEIDELAVKRIRPVAPVQLTHVESEDAPIPPEEQYAEADLSSDKEVNASVSKRSSRKRNGGRVLERAKQPKE